MIISFPLVDTAPNEWWQYDILEQEPEDADKFREIVAAVKQMCECEIMVCDTSLTEVPQTSYKVLASTRILCPVIDLCIICSGYRQYASSWF